MGWGEEVLFCNLSGNMEGIVCGRRVLCANASIEGNMFSDYERVGIDGGTGLVRF